MKKKNKETTQTNTQKAIQEIEAQFGKDAIFRMDGKKSIPVDFISTGSLRLNEALGVGGIPCGRVTEIYGPESSGKTTLCLHIIAEAQKKGGEVAFIDAEHALDLDYAKSIGVDTDKLYVCQPDSGEQALEITDTLIRSNEFSVVVVDSVAALTPRAELEGEMGQAHMGLQARLMSQGLRKLTGVIAKTNTALIFTNQLRMKIGVMFGNPETTTGGNALKFYASVRLDIRPKEKITLNNVIVGNNVRIKIVKNKVAPPFKVVDTCIMFGVGIDIAGELLQYHIELGTIEKSGAWYNCPSQEFKCQGELNMHQYIRDNMETFKL